MDLAPESHKPKVGNFLDVLQPRLEVVWSATHMDPFVRAASIATMKPSGSIGFNPTMRPIDQWDSYLARIATAAAS